MCYEFKIDCGHSHEKIYCPAFENIKNSRFIKRWQELATGATVQSASHYIHNSMYVMQRQDAQYRISIAPLPGIYQWRDLCMHVDMSADNSFR